MRSKTELYDGNEKIKGMEYLQFCNDKHRDLDFVTDTGVSLFIAPIRSGQCSGQFILAYFSRASNKNEE